jgi:hypothetical protein
MKRWKINPVSLAVLGCLVFLMLLILVLPDVDLPDFTFHRGTAPVLLHAQATAAPAVTMIAAVRQRPDMAEAYRPFYQAGTLADDPDPHSRLISLRTIRR